MFEDLTTNLENALKSFRGQDKISENNIEPAIKAVRNALLDADVNLNVVREFIQEVKEESLGTEVIRGINPEQKFIDIVNKKLIDILGGQNEGINLKKNTVTVIMLVGLQGAGKTTAAAKLASFFKKSNQRILLVAADTFRPAAKDQLRTLGNQVNIDVYTGEKEDSSVTIATNGKRMAVEGKYDLAIVDTAGRLYVDDELMDEVVYIRDSITPDEILLVVDSMIGQEAADLTRSFNERVGITGAILTKLDGDSRGGAALSIKKVSGQPIKFIGTGEKIEGLEAFYPERIASRILGMGDILTLVDKAQQEVSISDVVRMQEKFQEASFDFTDFLQQMKLIKRMGSLGGLIKLLPGMNKVDDKMLKSGELQLKKIQAMIDSMNVEERKDPKLLSKSPKRRRRVAFGSGHSEAEVDKMLVDFDRMRGMMQGIVKGDFSKLQAGLSRSDKSQGGEFDSTSRMKSNQQIKKKESRKKKGFFEL
jgi:signal recognition particle subunit SRP54